MARKKTQDTRSPGVLIRVYPNAYAAAILQWMAEVDGVTIDEIVQDLILEKIRSIRAYEEFLLRAETKKIYPHDPSDPKNHRPAHSPVPNV